jgi:hypothetical protein
MSMSNTPNASARGGMRSTTEKEFPEERKQEAKDENYNDTSNGDFAYFSYYGRS